jgi:beta-glucosidase/6-phospho-beta-glucosidase/beta-galactosidase
VPASDVTFALTQAKLLGSKWIRVNVQWSDVQYNGANSWDWSGGDKVIDAANTQGGQSLALLTYSPKWAIPLQYQGLTAKNDWERYGPANVNDFANFAAAAAARYSAKGVHAFEIWNEANCQYWKSVHSYAPLRNRAHAREPPPRSRGVHQRIIATPAAGTPGWAQLRDRGARPRGSALLRGRAFVVPPIAA